MATTINQRVVLDIQAKTDQAQTLINSLLQQFKGMNLSSSFSKTFINALQSMLIKSEDLKKTISETNIVNSKTVNGWSNSYDKLGSNVINLLSQLKNKGINFKDLIDYDEKQFNKLNEDLTKARNAQKEIYSQKNIKTQMSLAGVSVPTSVDKNISAAIIQNIAKQKEVNTLVDTEIKKREDLIKIEQNKQVALQNEIINQEKLNTLISDVSNHKSGLKNEFKTRAVDIGLDPSQLTSKSAAMTYLTSMQKDVSINPQQIATSAAAVDNYTKEIQELGDFLLKIAPVIINLATAFSNTQKPINDAGNELQKFKQDLIDAAQKALNLTTPELEKLRQAMGGAATTTRDYAAATQEAEQKSQFFTNMQTKIKHIFGLANAYQILRRAMQQAWSAIKELDAAFTEIAVVTEYTNEDLWKSFDVYNKMAQQLGVTTVDAIKTSALYYQQGLETADVMTLTTQTIKMARIAGMDFGEATKAMTAAIRGFKLEMQEASRVTDVYSALAAESAVDTQQLATAMSKTASIAGNAGMSFESTSAFLAQIIETTQEAAETAGTAVKTIIARFTELKKNPAKLSIEVEGEEVNANKIEEALKLAGVNLRDVNGQFRDLDDVFTEVSKAWDGLDRNTQRYIATIAAGSRQQSRFIAMMSDYERTQELIGIANDSADAGEIQFAKTLDSISAKLDKIKTSFQQLIGIIVKNKTVKALLDMINKGMQTLVSAAEKGPAVFIAFIISFGLVIKNLLSSMIGVFQAGEASFVKFKTVVTNTILRVPLDVDTTEAEQKIKNIKAQAAGRAPVATPTDPVAGDTTTPKGEIPATGVGKQVGSLVAKGAASGLTTGLITGLATGSLKTGLIVGASSLITSVLSSAAVTAAIGTALSAVALPALIVAGVGALLYGIYKLTDKVSIAERNAKKALKALEKATEETQESKAAYITERENIEAIAEKIEKYKILSDKINLTGEEQRELNELSNEIGEKFPELIQSYDKQGNLILKQYDIWQDILKVQKEILRVKEQGYGQDVLNEALLAEQVRLTDIELIEVQLDSEMKELNDLKQEVEAAKGIVPFEDLPEGQDPTAYPLSPAFAQAGTEVEYEAALGRVEGLESAITKLELQAELSALRISNAYKLIAKSGIDSYNSIMDAESEIPEELYGAAQIQLAKKLEAELNKLASTNFDESGKLTEAGAAAAAAFSDEFTTTLRGQLESLDMIDLSSIIANMADNTKSQFIEALKKKGIFEDGANATLYDTLIVLFETKNETRDSMLDALIGAPVIDLSPYLNSKDLEDYNKQIEALKQEFLAIFGDAGITNAKALYGEKLGVTFLDGLKKDVDSGKLDSGLAGAIAQMDLTTVAGAEAGITENPFFAGLSQDEIKTAIALIEEYAQTLGEETVITKGSIFNKKAQAKAVNEVTKAELKGISAAEKIGKVNGMTTEELEELAKLYPDLADEIANYLETGEGLTELQEALRAKDINEISTEFIKNLETDIKAVADAKEGTDAYNDAIIKVQESLNNTNWKGSAEDLKLLEKAANGDTAAINVLKKALAENLVLKVLGVGDFELLKQGLLDVNTLSALTLAQLAAIDGVTLTYKKKYPELQELASDPNFTELANQFASGIDIDFSKIRIPSYTPPRGGGGGGSEPKESDVSAYYNEIEAVERLNNKLDDLKDARDSGILSHEDYLKNLEETIATYRDLQSQLQKYTSGLSAERSILEDKINALGVADAIKVSNGILIVNRKKVLELSKTTQESIDSMIDDWEKLTDAIEKNVDAIKKAADAQIELLEESKDSYLELEQKVIDILIKQDEELIETKKKNYDKLKEQDADYLDALRKNIESRRKARDKDESFEDLATKERKLALLRRDTSGVYSSEIAELEKELKDTRQDLADAEVDDLLNGLEERNQIRADGYDKEIQDLEDAQEAKLKSMAEYNAEANNIMQKSYEDLIAWFKTNDEEYYKASTAAQEKYLKTLQDTVNKAQSITAAQNNLALQMVQNSAAWHGASPEEQRALSDANLKMGSTMGWTRDESSGIWYNETGSPAYQDQAVINAVIEEMKKNSEAWKTASAAEQKRLADRNLQLGTVMGWIRKNDGFWYYPDGVTRVYKKGGLVNYTGLAQVDGTPTRPEAFLSARDTQNFIKLAEILNGVMSSFNTKVSTDTTNIKNGNVTIYVTVDSISNDYDIDKAIEKVKQSIMEGARYRNVNIVNRMR